VHHCEASPLGQRGLNIGRAVESIDQCFLLNSTRIRDICSRAKQVWFRLSSSLSIPAAIFLIFRKPTGADNCSCWTRPTRVRAARHTPAYFSSCFPRVFRWRRCVIRTWTRRYGYAWAKPGFPAPHPGRPRRPVGAAWRRWPKSSTPPASAQHSSTGACWPKWTVSRSTTTRFTRPLPTASTARWDWFSLMFLDTLWRYFVNLFYAIGIPLLFLCVLQAATLFSSAVSRLLGVVFFSKLV